MNASTHTLTIHCTCGNLSLTAAGVAPEVANQVVCHCDGCQTFAHRMGHPEILDAAGGTRRLQISPASLSITTGHIWLACIQQTSGGAFRWYARCCNTPIALTLPQPRVPFVAIDVLRVEVADHAPDLEDVLGPVRARVNTSLRSRDARLQRADALSLLAMLWHLMPLTFRWWWRSDQRRSPFFNAETGAPIIEPVCLYDPPKRLAGGCR